MDNLWQGNREGEFVNSLIPMGVFCINQSLWSVSIKLLAQHTCGENWKNSTKLRIKPSLNVALKKKKNKKTNNFIKKYQDITWILLFFFLKSSIVVLGKSI